MHKHRQQVCDRKTLQRTQKHFDSIKNQPLLMKEPRQTDNGNDGEKKHHFDK